MLNKSLNSGSLPAEISHQSLELKRLSKLVHFRLENGKIQLLRNVTEVLPKTQVIAAFTLKYFKSNSNYEITSN